MIASFANSLQEIQDSGVFRVAVYGNNAPFSKKGDNGFQGFEIDFAKKLAEKIFAGKEGRVEFVALDGDARIEALQNNTVDAVIAMLTITEDRTKVIDFTMPYFSVNFAALTRKDSNIKTANDLKGRTIIVRRGHLAEKELQKKGFSLITCENTNECYGLLKEGKGDAFVHTNTMILTYGVIDPTVESAVQNMGQTEFIGIGVQKGNTSLTQALNQALIDLSKDKFFAKAFDEKLDPFYKGKADKKYFLLDDIYNIFG